MKRICIPLLLASVILCANPSVVLAGETAFGAEIHAENLLHLNNQGRGKNFNEANISRGWLYANHTFSDKYEAQLVLESENVGAETSSYSWQVHLRRAQLQVNRLVPYVTARFGMQDQLYIRRVEDVWGLRFVDRVSMHKLGYLDEADIGVSVIGKCPSDWGILAIQVVNGSGYRMTDANKYKDIALYAEIVPFPKNPDFSELAIFGQIYLGQPNVSVPPSVTGASENIKKERYSGAFVFKYRKWLTAFAEVFQAKDDDDYTTPSDDEFVDDAFGYSLLGRVHVATTDRWLAKLSLFAKYEWIDRNRNAEGLKADEDDARSLVTGLAYVPIEGYEIAISIRRDTRNVIIDDLRINEEERNFFLLNFRANIN